KPEPKPEPVKPEPVAEVKVEVAPEPPKVEAPVVTPAATENNTPADEPQDDEVIRAKAERLTGPNIIGKIQLPSAQKRNPVASSSNSAADHKRKRKQIG